MSSNNAATVLNEAAKSLAAYREGSIYDHQLMLKSCFDNLNGVLEQVWQAVHTGPVYQHSPASIAYENNFEASVRIIKELQQQITSGKIELFKLNSQANLDALATTIKLFAEIDDNIQEKGPEDYSHLNPDELQQLTADFQAATGLLNATYKLLAH